ncbi:MAG: hypothetical protein CM15mP23_19690 [Cryomorphaceae bacterium]|nr:MAG: hypothetical protein CM15mP23_19690 [Cryomorphaceae bacterium]
MDMTTTMTTITNTKKIVMKEGLFAEIQTNKGNIVLSL